jgi:predicted DNA-binding ribbon-helix-helix protein
MYFNCIAIFDILYKIFLLDLLMVNLMLRHRTQVISGKKTSIALGRVFGDAIDRISNGNWRRWVLHAIEDKRKDVGR